MLSDYNIISLGDHCALPHILQHMNIRKKSYPFDWISHFDQILDTNIMINFSIIEHLFDTKNIDSTLKLFLGDGVTLNALHNYNWFPHEHGTIEENTEKYKRRFERLYNDIQHEKNLFLMLTRIVYIKQRDFDRILNFIMQFNPHNKILFISGCHHEYLNSPQYKDSVIFKYIYYDHTKFYQYDWSDFRPRIKDYLVSLF